MEKIAIILVCLMYLGCTDDGTEIQSAAAPATLTETMSNTTTSSPNGDEITYEMKNNQKQSVGKVSVTNDNSNLYVSYETYLGWTLKNIYLFSGNAENIPIKSDVISVIDFPLKITFKDLRKKYQFIIPLKNIINKNRTCISIVSKINVVNTTLGDNISNEECWSGDLSYNSNNRESYFKYCLNIINSNQLQ